MNPSFSKILESYRNYLLFERRLQKATVLVYVPEIKYFLEYLEISGENLNSFNLDTVEKYLGESSEKRKLSSRTGAKDFSALNSFVGYLIITNVRLNNPLENIDTIKIDYKTTNTKTLIRGKIDYFSFRERFLDIKIYNRFNPNSDKRSELYELIHNARSTILGVIGLDHCPVLVFL